MIYFSSNAIIDNYNWPVWLQSAVKRRRPMRGVWKNEVCRLLLRFQCPCRWTALKNVEKYAKWRSNVGRGSVMEFQWWNLLKSIIESLLNIFFKKSFDIRLFDIMFFGIQNETFRKKKNVAPLCQKFFCMSENFVFIPQTKKK